MRRNPGLIVGYCAVVAACGALYFTLSDQPSEGAWQRVTPVAEDGPWIQVTNATCKPDCTCDPWLSPPIKCWVRTTSAGGKECKDENNNSYICNPGNGD